MIQAVEWSPRGVKITIVVDVLYNTRIHDGDKNPLDNHDY